MTIFDTCRPRPEVLHGTVADTDFAADLAQVLVKEFLEPQLLDTRSRSVQALFELTFTEGLTLRGDAAESLSNRLCRFASGVAHVSASAEAKS